MCNRRLFFTEFNAQQLLFKVGSDIMNIFGNFEVESESTFPLQYTIIFETYQSLETSTSLTSLYEI